MLSRISSAPSRRGGNQDNKRLSGSTRADRSRERHREDSGSGADVGHELTWPESDLSDDLIDLERFHPAPAFQRQRPVPRGPRAELGGNR